MAFHLLHSALVLVTMDSQRTEIPDGAVLVRDNQIEAVGTTAHMRRQAERLSRREGDIVSVDLTGHVVLPGLVNTHHHMYQSLTRAVPAAQNADLFDWLKTLYPIWGRLTPEAVYISAKTAMLELILSGCTTSSDHLYLFPNGTRLEDTIRAAHEIGMRFHPTRGSMSLGESKGGLPPDSLVEDEAAILRDTRRLIETYHDPARFAMVRVGVAPCSPFSVTQDLMRDAAALARSFGADQGVRLHTHLAETAGDVAFSREKFGLEPAQYAEDAGWVGSDVWHAHCVKLTETGIALFSRTGTGVAHCPSSNMRLASGIAPIRQMRDQGVRVGLGVDGSASNDGAHMLGEARQAMLLARIDGTRSGDPDSMGHPAALTARDVLEIATRGGAAVLGRDDIGVLAPGMAADVVAFDMHREATFAGALHDPVAALVFSWPAQAAFSMINGRILIEQGELITIDLGPLLAHHNVIARDLMNG